MCNTLLDRLRLVASADGADGSLRWGQDVRLYASLLSAGSTVDVGLPPNRHAWVQVVRGDLDVNGQSLRSGDAVGVSDETQLILKAREDCEFLVFDLP